MMKPLIIFIPVLTALVFPMHSESTWLSQRHKLKNEFLQRTKRQFLFNRTPAPEEEPPCGGGRECEDPETEGAVRCLPPQQECDGVVHCREGADELNCTCSSRIDPAYLCDEYEDCPDGGDEKGCGKTCGPDERACFPPNPLGTPLCVQQRHVCDGFRHCDDGSDEACVRLSLDPLLTQGERGWQSKGYLQFRTGISSWAPVCADDHNLATRISSLCDDVAGERAAQDKFTTARAAAGEAGPCSTGRVYAECAAPACQSSVDFSAFVAAGGVEQRRIIGGMLAHEGAWPSVVSLRKDGEHDCGGTVLSASHVLVAAHCMRSARRHIYEVVAGMYRRSTYGPTVQVVPVREIFVHANFSSNSLVNDIALLELKVPLHLNKWVRPVCLPDPDKIWIMGHECAIAGWGFVKPRTHTVDKLQHALVPISSLTTCQEVYGTRRIPDTHKVLCAGLKAGGRDACSGDSGGPLLCRVCSSRGSILDCHHKNWTQDGIVSFGKGCAEPGIPGVYTSVRHYLPWIAGVMQYGKDSEGVRHITPRLSAAHRCTQPWNASLPEHKFCDGHVDCLDAEDERSYPSCKKKKATVAEAPSDHSYHPLAPIASTDATLSGAVTSACPNSTFACVTNGECVPEARRCDGVRHCGDGSDEVGCTCILRLQAARSELLCDTVPDCFDGSDELCSLCPEGSHECLESKQCVGAARVCDQKFDCTFGEDEVGCITLAGRNSSEVLLSSDGAPVRRSQGFFVIKHGSTELFSPVCRTNMAPHQLDEICNFLGYENMTAVEYVDSPDATQYGSRLEERSLDGSELFDSTVHQHQRRSSRRYNDERFSSRRAVDGGSLANNDVDSFTLSRRSDYSNSGNETEQEPTGLKEMVRSETDVSEGQARSTVDIQETLVTSSYSSLKHRSKRQVAIAKNATCSKVHVTCGAVRCGTVPRVLRAGSNYTGFGSQPWAVGVYSGGQYVCGATLVHQQWALTSWLCVRENRLDSGSLVVVGGSYRGPISGMRVEGPFERERAVLQMQIVSEDLLLLRLASELPETNYISPLCLPKRETTWPGPWVQCAAVGYDGDTLTRHLQLSPSVSSCPAHKVCVQPYDLPPGTCANQWSGLIACINSTTPMTRWVAVGIWHNNLLGCSNPTQHPLLTNDLLLSIRLGMILPSPTSRTRCGGHQCPFGKCVPEERVCDGRPDCADFSDEPKSCPLPAFRCRDADGPVRCACPADQRACWSGSCVSSDAFCDGARDCQHGEDERDCSCAALLAQRPSTACDGVLDCPEGEDELQCGCSVNHSFRCFRSGSTRTCLPLQFLCDGARNCPEGEDELHCSALLRLPALATSRDPIDSSLLAVDLDVLGRPKPQRSGLFMLRYRGRWYTYSFSAWPANFSLRLCENLGYTKVTSTPRTLLPNFNTDPETAARSVQGIRGVPSYDDVNWTAEPSEEANVGRSAEDDLDVIHIECQ